MPTRPPASYVEAKHGHHHRYLVCVGWSGANIFLLDRREWVVVCEWTCNEWERARVPSVEEVATADVDCSVEDFERAKQYIERFVLSREAGA
jgi:hypothetical protein